MYRRFVKTFVPALSLGLALTFSGCFGSNSSRQADLDPPVSPPGQSSPAKKPQVPDFIDVPKLANKPAQAFDEIFGAAVKVSEITDDPAMMPGEFRLYNVAGNPKGLSVRFYKGKAKRFNLLLGTPGKSSKGALAGLFRIDVSRMKPVRDEILSEKWAGESGGVRFKTAYAKRETLNGDFTMVHAEVEQ